MTIPIKFVVLGHHSRRSMAIRLAERLNAHLLIDEGDNGANYNHRRAIEWAAEQNCRVVILEDDALPVANFTHLVTEWLTRFPDNLCSFYLGTGRPPQYQLQIAANLIEADRVRADHIMLPRLIHGVCYSVPPAQLARTLQRWDIRKPADYAVGDACGGSVVYPCESFVEHDDGPSVERPRNNMARSERRRAWRLHRGFYEIHDKAPLEVINESAN